MYNSYVSLAVIFPLIEAWITTSNSCLKWKKLKITKNIENAGRSVSFSLSQLFVSDDSREVLL